jgi:hypothetical protein
MGIRGSTYRTVPWYVLSRMLCRADQGEPTGCSHLRSMLPKHFLSLHTSSTHFRYALVRALVICGLVMHLRAAKYKNTCMGCHGAVDTYGW